MELSKFVWVIFVIGLFAALFLFTPYEAYLEGALAIGMVTGAALGFLMHPRREVFYIRTAVRLVDPDRNQTLEQDLLAVRAELTRLWLLFVPTLLAAVILVFFAAGGPMKFSYLNWIFSSRYSYIVSGLLSFVVYPPILVLILLSAWIEERRVMRDAEACNAQSFTIFPARNTRSVGRVSYAFRGEHGEYYGGDCSYFAFSHPRELASVVFHNVRKPDLNKIVMGFLFYRFIVLGRGVTDLDKQTAAAQAVLAETTHTA